MMFDFLNSKTAVIISYCLIIIFKILYAVIIYKTCDNLSKKQRNVLTYLSFVLPIITGIICTVKCKNNRKKQLSVLFMLVITLAVYVSAAVLISYSNHPKLYDSNGEIQLYKSDMSFTDADGNRYTFDFETSGFDKLYMNGTDEYLNTDLCYLNKNGYLIYDEDMSITAQDEHSCVDEDGTVYYPIKYSEFSEDGSVIYSFNSANFSYDKFKNAYTYRDVPFYDKDLNKYSYSFDSDQQKGFYINILTGERFENEYCFVDEDGYLVYDENHTFTMHENDKGIKIYTDSDGKTYFWASSIHWDLNGSMIDSHGNILSA